MPKLDYGIVLIHISFTIWVMLWKCLPHGILHVCALFRSHCPASGSLEDMASFLPFVSWTSFLKSHAGGADSLWPSVVGSQRTGPVLWMGSNNIWGWEPGGGGSDASRRRCSFFHMTIFC